MVDPPGFRQAPGCIVTINGGSSSLKFALYTADDHPELRIAGQIERIGQPGTQLRAQAPDGQIVASSSLPDGACHRVAARELLALLRRRFPEQSIVGFGHRVTHAGLGQSQEHRLVTPALVRHLKDHQSIAPLHLPPQIALIEAFVEDFGQVPHAACFDTAFHDPMPAVAKRLPIPRQYSEKGIRKYAFHGLSYEYLMQALAEQAGRQAAQGRVILAHLGSGSSMAAVRGGQPMDSTMSFTPTAGLVMGSRPGDLDAGLVTYLMRQHSLSVAQVDAMLNNQCGLVGISGSKSGGGSGGISEGIPGGGGDMRDLLARRQTDPHAAEALESYCYQARKWIGALAAVMGGLNTLVFSAGIGENIALIRRWICEPLHFLGVELDAARNDAHETVISTDASPITVRVIPTDEQAVIVRIVRRLSQQ